MSVLHPVTGSEVSVETVTKHFWAGGKTLFYRTSAHRQAPSPSVCPDSPRSPFNPTPRCSASWQLSHKQDGLASILQRHFLQ